MELPVGTVARPPALTPSTTARPTSPAFEDQLQISLAHLQLLPSTQGQPSRS